MEHATDANNGDVKRGQVVCALGWVILLLSIWFGMISLKVDDSPSRTLYWVCLAVLASVAATYVLGRLVSVQWRAKTLRSCLSPYLVGTICWLAFFLLVFIVDRFAN
jgi:hypothetical protein